MVTTYRASRIELAAEDLTAYADGERLGPLPITAECVPGAVRVAGAG
jgi:diacylglycerol kinase (ATP)